MRNALNQKFCDQFQTAKSTRVVSNLQVHLQIMVASLRLLLPLKLILVIFFTAE